MKKIIIENKNKIIITSLIIIFLVVTFFFGFTINLKEGKEVEIILSSTPDFVDPGYNASLYFIKLPIKVTVEGKVKADKVGTYELVYSYKFIRNVSKTRVVKVLEKEQPVIKLKGETNIKACPNGKYKEEGYTAIDNYDGDITNNVTIEQKDGKIIYKVIDSSGNQTSTERNITYIDEAAPVITLKGGNKISIYQGETYTDPGYTAIDDCLGDITEKVTTEGTINTSEIGTYKIKYNVSDGINTTSQEREIYVAQKTTSTDTTPQVSIGTVYPTLTDGIYTCEGIDTSTNGIKTTIVITFRSGFSNKVLTSTEYQYKEEADSYKQILSNYPNQYRNVAQNNKIITYENVTSAYLDTSYANVVEILKSELNYRKWKCK